MASQDWIDQFNANQNIISRINGNRDERYDLDVVVPDLRERTSIADCGHICREDEMVRGWCPKCCHKGDEDESI